jgi:hypothetical protein
MNHVSSAVIIALLISIATGCCPRRQPDPRQAKLGELPSRQIDVRTVIRDGKFLPNSPLILHVREGSARYTALIGTARGQAPAAGVSIHNSDTSLIVTEGWIYLFGQYPHGGTRLVHASATGTTMILDHQAHRTRVVFLCAAGDQVVHVDAQVPAVGGEPRRTLSKPWHYIEVFEEAGQVRFGEIKRIPDPAADPDGIWQLLNTVNTSRQEAGLDGWCDPPQQRQP